MINVFIKLIVFIIFLSTIASVNVSAQGLAQKTVITNGSGANEKDAIKDALVAAVAQVRGLSIRSQEIVSIKAKVSNENTNSTADYQSHVTSFTQGLVTSFEILDSKSSNLSGGYQVSVKVTVPVYNASSQINRLRLAVVPLKIQEGISNEDLAERFSKKWMANLEEGLVQSRRFAMLDRSFTEATNQEISQYTNGSFSIGELARLGQRAGTDYLVTGELKKYDVIDKSVTNPLTGENIPRSATYIEISLRIIDVATGQVKFAKSYSNYPKVALFDIINAIYPISIVSVSGDEVIIGQGGDDIKNGQRFQVVSLGQELKDPYSGESLGRQESEIGEVEIIDVQSKTSRAIIIVGKNAISNKFPQGLILRSGSNSALGEDNPASKQPKMRRSVDTGSKESNW